MSVNLRTFLNNVKFNEKTEVYIYMNSSPICSLLDYKKDKVLKKRYGSKIVERLGVLNPVNDDSAYITINILREFEKED